ncbi:MAG TPA: hypothetical protein VG347_00840 [Verrucomicrobiae bacterium]|nr:hypothetical protein [Verrucomicrobiae bacterium]
MNTDIQKSDSKNPVVITATWDGVRYWQNATKMFEQGKLFGQVMIGFELLALQKQHGVANGNNQHAGRVSQNGKPSMDWETILEKEAGLAQSTAYRYMDMAKAAAPRLKKLPALRDFDPFSTSLAKLPEPQREAMATAVKKLTDGKSQADFFEELYKTSGSQANANPDGGKNRKNLSMAEEASLRHAKAVKQWHTIDKMLTVFADAFTLPGFTDHDTEAQCATLEKALAARKAWLKQPLNGRNPKVIAEMFKGGSK